MEKEHKTTYVPVKDLSYTQAVTELEHIIRLMQGDDVDIDRLSEYTARAAELLAECRSRLTTTDKELQSILATLEPQQ